MRVIRTGQFVKAAVMLDVHRVLVTLNCADVEVRRPGLLGGRCAAPVTTAILFVTL